jgi:replicative DNA helicase
MSEVDLAYQEEVETESSLLMGVINLRADIDTPSHLTSLSPEMFVGRGHGLIWQAFQAIAGNGGIIDAWSTGKAMRKMGGDTPDLHALERVFAEAGNRFDAADLRPRIAKVADAYKRNVLARAMEGLSKRAMVAPLADVESEMAELMGKVSQAGNPRLRAATDYARQFEAYLSGAPILPPESQQNLTVVGVPAIDSTIVANPGRLIVIGGLPSAGKTALAVQLAVRSAQFGRRVAMGSLEMDEDEISARIVACACSVNSLVALRCAHTPSPEDRAVLDAVRRGIVGIHGCAGDSWSSIESAIVREHRRSKLDVAIVDYLQLLGEPDTRSRRNDTEAQAIGEITKSAKRLAQRLGINVVMLSQFNRKVEEGQEPTLQNFLGSGQIERDIDIALLLWNTDSNPQPGADRSVSCRVAKNRGGERYKRINLIFNPARNQFTESNKATKSFHEYDPNQSLPIGG